MTTETALCQVKVDGRWEDYARTTPRLAEPWVKAKPEVRRAVDWIERNVLYPVPLSEAQKREQERADAHANFVFAGARALHELEWAHDSNECPVCQRGRV